MLFLKQRSFWFLTLLVLTTAVLIAAGRLYWTPADLPVYGQVADFELTERSGKDFSLKDLQGKVWIADFIFTRCGGICPMMSFKMKMIQARTRNLPELKLVSFSVDPEHDTPEIMAEYARRFDADPAKWFFLTGEKSQLFKLSSQHFYLGVSDIPEAERQAPDQSIDHSSKFVLVDAEGKIRGYYASEEENFFQQLEKDINRLSYGG